MGKNHHKIQSPEVVEEGKRLQLEIKKKFKNYETASQAFNIEEIGFSVSKATIAQYCGGSIRIPDKKLFYIANKLGRNASCLMTVVDSLFDKRSLTSEEREKSFIL